MRALVLAAGLGTRLFPLTLFRSKPTVPFLNRPVVHYSLELIQKAGIKEIAVNLHHLPESVRAAVDAFGADVRYALEREILGTGGAIANLRHFLGGDDFVVCNGKIYFEEDLSEAIRFHRRHAALVTLVLVPGDLNPGFNPVYVNAECAIRGFGPRYKPTPAEHAMVFTGVHILSPRILDLLPDRASDSVRDLYMRLIESHLPVFGFPSQSYWCEISQPSRYLSKSLEVLERRGLRNLVGGEQRAEGGPWQRVIAPDSTCIHPTAVLDDCIIWEGGSIGERANLRRVIVAGNIRVPPDARFADLILTRVPDGFEAISDRGGRKEGEIVVWPLA